MADKLMMKCGHAANAVGKDNKPCCVICAGIIAGAYEVDDSPPSLIGRKAICAYSATKRHGEVDSSPNLAFFEYRPERQEDIYYCGCRGWD